MAELLVLVPALSRPHRVRPLVHSIAETCPADTHVLFVLDPGDEEEIAAVKDAAAFYRVTRMETGGTYPQKINRGLDAIPFDYVFLGADDLEFRPGWYEAATEQGAEVVGINDLIPRPRDHQTHFLVTRDYVERGQIDGESGLLHEGYSHCCVDDEFIAVAKHREAYAYAAEAHVKHLHPMVGEPTDAVYEKGMSTLRNDRWTFQRRRKLWRPPSA